MTAFLSQKQKTIYYNQNSRSFSGCDANLAAVITQESNSLIYHSFTGDVNFPVLCHYIGCQCDITNVKNFHEILTYFFQILTTPMKTKEILYTIRRTHSEIFWKSGIFGIQNCHKKFLKIKKIYLRNISERVHFYVTFHISSLQLYKIGKLLQVNLSSTHYIFSVFKVFFTV